MRKSGAQIQSSKKFFHKEVRIRPVKISAKQKVYTAKQTNKVTKKSIK